MMAAGESVMTVNFNKKIDEDHIKSILNGAGKKADFKKISKQITVGKEVEMTCLF